MRTAYRNYQCQDTVFEGKIVFMRCRNMTLRADVENHRLRFSCPYGTPVSTIDKTISKALPDLVKKLASRPKPIQGGTAYVLGEKVPFEGDEEAFASCFKREAERYFESRVRLYERIMGVTPPYKVKAKSMKTRLGSNSSRTNTIFISTYMFHFPQEVVDSVVIHELSHHFAMDHSDKFYGVLLKYCPDYDNLRKRIIAHKYGKDNL